MATGWSTRTLLLVCLSLSALAFTAGRFWPAPSTAPYFNEGAAGKATRALPATAFVTEGALQTSDSFWYPQSGISAGQNQRLVSLEQQDPAAAWKLAELEPNGRLRRLRCLDVLRAWATIAPESAAQKALSLPLRDRAEAMTAVFQGVAQNPETAVRTATAACISDPELAVEYGRNLIETLAEKGAFPALVGFATSGPVSHRAEWLSATYYQWAEREPREALQALDRINTVDGKAAAFQGLILGWAKGRPSDLAEYAVTLPDGEGRSLALRPALDEWLQQNPKQALAWMMERDPGPDLDQGASAIATTPELMLQQPDVALGWAQSIVEPTLRSSTLRLLVQNWNDRDPALARQMVNQATNLLPADRQVLQDSLNASAQTVP